MLYRKVIFLYEYYASIYTKKTTKTALMATTFCVAAILLMKENKELPKFSQIQPPFDLPELYLHKQAVKENIYIEAIFIHQIDNEQYEITLSMNDENHPMYNEAYDIRREFRYKRKHDLESFIVYVQNNQIQHIEFPWTYAGNSKYDDTNNLHKNGKVVNSGKLFLSTRNKMFNVNVHDTDNYTHIPMDRIIIYKSSREKLNNYFSN